MKVSSHKLALYLCMRARLAAMIWGDPGIGKTKSVEQLAKELGYHLETVIASIREPTDIGGHPVLAKELPRVDREAVAKFFHKMLKMEEHSVSVEEVDAAFDTLVALFGVPKVENGAVRLAPPLWAKNIIEADAAGKIGMVFLDELPTARPAVQVALLRIAIDKVAGDTALPKNTVIVAAGNIPEHTSGNWDLTPPLANRFVHIDWEVDVDEWCHGVMYQWPTPKMPEIPENWEEGIRKSEETLVGFIKSRRELLHLMPKEQKDASRAWSSPRTWLDMLVPAYTIAMATGVEPEVINILCNGCVGDGAGAEFVTYAENLDLPDPEDILKDPMGCTLPSDRDDLMYVALGSVVHAISGNLTAARWYAGWKVLRRAAEVGAEDVPIAHAYSLASIRPEDASSVPDELMHFSSVLKEAGIL